MASKQAPADNKLIIALMEINEVEAQFVGNFLNGMDEHSGLSQWTAHKLRITPFTVVTGPTTFGDKITTIRVWIGPRSRNKQLSDCCDFDLANTGYLKVAPINKWIEVLQKAFLFYSQVRQAETSNIKLVADEAMDDAVSK